MRKEYILPGIFIALLLCMGAFCSDQNEDTKSQPSKVVQQELDNISQTNSEQSPIIFEAGARDQFLTEIFQSAIPLMRELAEEIKFQNIQTGMTLIQQINISIQPNKNPFVEVELPSNEDDIEKKDGEQKAEKNDDEEQEDIDSDNKKDQKAESKNIKKKLVKLAALNNIAKVSLCNESQSIYLTLQNIRVSGNSTLSIIVGAGNSDRHKVNFSGSLNSITIGYSITEKKFDYFDFQFDKDSLSIGFLSQMELMDRKQLQDSSIQLLTQNKQLLIDELKPKINDIVFDKLKQVAGMIIAMQEGYKDNPLGFKITQTQVLMLIQQLLPEIEVSEDSKYIRHQKRHKNITSDKQAKGANAQTPTTEPPSQTTQSHGAWLTFHESIPNNRLYPMFYSDKKQNEDNAYFFDLYNLMKNVGFSHLATISNASLLLPKLSEDFPDDKNAPVSLTCSLSESELSKVMKQTRRPQMKFKESNLLLRFGVTCSIKVKIDKKISDPSNSSADDFDDDYVQIIDSDMQGKNTTNTETTKSESKQIATEEEEWQNYRSIFCEPVIKLKAKINKRKSPTKNSQQGDQQNQKGQNQAETEIALKELDLGSIKLIDKDGNHLQSEQNMLNAMISFGKNMLLGKANGFLKSMFNKSLISTRQYGERNCFPLDIEQFFYDTIKGWFYIGVDVKSMMDNEDDLIRSDCAESMLGNFKDKIGEIENSKASSGFSNIFRSFAGIS